MFMYMEYIYVLIWIYVYEYLHVCMYFIDGMKTLKVYKYRHFATKYPF